MLKATHGPNNPEKINRTSEILSELEAAYYVDTRNFEGKSVVTQFSLYTARAISRVLQKEARIKRAIELINDPSTDLTAKGRPFFGRSTSESSTILIHYCCEQDGMLPIVKALLDKGVSPNLCEGVWGNAPLSDAVSTSDASKPRDPSIAKLLLEYGANPNTLSGYSENTVLMYVIQFFNEEIALALIEHGADVKRNIPSMNNILPLNLLVDTYNNEHNTSTDETQKKIKEKYRRVIGAIWRKYPTEERQEQRITNPNFYKDLEGILGASFDEVDSLHNYVLK